MTYWQAYKTLYETYPDLLDIAAMCEMLSISSKTAYKLLRENRITHLKVGRAYRIPKVNVIDYLMNHGRGE